jgi:hypothetical protein
MSKLSDSDQVYIGWNIDDLSQSYKPKTLQEKIMLGILAELSNINTTLEAIRNVYLSNNGIPDAEGVKYGYADVEGEA